MHYMNISENGLLKQGRIYRVNFCLTLLIDKGRPRYTYIEKTVEIIDTYYKKIKNPAQN